MERKWGFCSEEEIKLKNIKFNLSEFVKKTKQSDLSINMPCLDFLSNFETKRNYTEDCCWKREKIIFHHSGYIDVRGEMSAFEDNIKRC